LSSYTIISGDTFDSISRKVYGIESNASLLAQSNPGIVQPLTPGVLIFTPSDPRFPDKSVQHQIQNDETEEVALIVDGVRLRVWETMRIRRSLDSFDSVTFTAPFEADTPNFREIFEPFTFKDVQVYVGGDLFFNGTMINSIPSVTPSRKAIVVSCYSRPGILNDCTMPPGSYPLQFLNQSISTISKTLCAPFGLASTVNGDEGAVFKKATLETSRKVLEFLKDLAQQVNLVITNDESGGVVLQSSVSSGEPVATLEEGTPAVETVIPSFNPQNYFSHITGIKSTILNLPGRKVTVANKHLKGIVRPMTFEVNDTQDGAVNKAVDARMGRMFGNMASYNVTVPSWRTASGNLWQANTIVKLTAPDAMIYEPYDFVIRSIDFLRDSNSAAVSLNLVMPGSFSGKVPDTLPWN